MDDQRNLFEGSPLASLSVGNDGRIARANARACELTGRELGQLVGMHVLDLCAATPAGGGRAAALFEQFLAGEPCRDEMLELVDGHGRPFWVRLSRRPQFDEGGRSIGARAMLVEAAPPDHGKSEMWAGVDLQAAALDSVSNAVMVTDPDGTIVWVNRAFTHMSGYSFDEAVGETPRLLKSGVQDVGHYRRLWETIRARKVWRGEIVDRHKDGGLYSVLQTITPIWDQDGEITHFVAVHEDVTTLRSSQARLQGLFDHASDAMILADDDGACVDANPAACALTGYTRDELLGMHPWDLTVGTNGQRASPEAVSGKWHQFLAEGTMAGEVLIRREDGTTVTCELRAVASIVPGVHLSTLRDVSAYRAAQNSLAASEAQFRQLADNATDIVAQLRVDDERAVELDYINPAVTTILGYTVEQVHADPDLLLRLFHDPEESDALEDVTPDIERPQSSVTVCVSGIEGHPVWLEANVSLADASTTPPTLQIIARDVTARQQTDQALRDALAAEQLAAERLRATDQLKSTFLQAISHELRTPLTSVLGYARTLVDRSDQLTPEQTGDFQRRIAANAHHLDALLTDLLDVERLNRGAVRLDLRPTDLAALIDEIIATIDFGGRACVFDPTTAIAVVDARKVERIVLNLLTNAVRHTPPDSTIWVSITSEPDTRTITVSDNGPGIPGLESERIFEPFWQGTNAQRAASPGTGVGLALVRQFTNLHGGTVRAEARPGGGVTFDVSLPHHPHPPTPQASMPLDVPALPVGNNTELAFGEVMRETLDQLHALSDPTSADGIILAYVQRLGGHLTTDDRDAPDILDVDLSVALPQPLRAAAPHGSAAREHLENHLPYLVELARRQISRGTEAPSRPR